MSPILYAVGKIFDKFTDNFIYYIMGFIAILQVLMILLVPTVILPLFNKFTPLEDGELKTKIEDLARKLKFPLDKIFVVDGSKRSSHSNAYFTGLPFFKQRIVIFDTLIEQSSVDEVVAVLGHEIGHWKKNHIIQLLLVGQFHISVIFPLFSAVYQNKSLYKSFGFNIESATGQKSVGKKVFLNNKFPYLIGFSIFGELLKPMDCLVQFIMNLFIRHNEYEADAFATKLGYGKELSQALITLQVANLSSMHVDPLYPSYHYNHPTLIERLDAIEAEIVKLEKKN
ncbi:M48 family metallopeptidase SCDLUD_005179 [Saccharomycodes ludwigii]|uniref:M48 family metallopeptidase n=1 Tax=Saccharomycodes ludwigii TaxID=36035 RepID=UPI001E887B5C|nr:hypothetical protein SCDLUD_005179 [Saccharomycodes ludwigii]KAH3898841.1 hypothetical protein SCDLUD_005179 [Saccharomycodes ludwigii]